MPHRVKLAVIAVVITTSLLSAQVAVLSWMMAGRAW